MPDEPVHELTNEQQELNEAKTLREQARARREQQEEETTARRMEQKRIESSQILIERLAESRGAMHRALAPFQLSAAGERGELSRKITYGFTKVLGDVLLDLREMGVLKKLEEVHDTATLAHYRQEQDDPEQVRIAYEYAKRIIQTDPTDHEHLLELVRYAEEEPALQKAWDWVQILLNGLTGKQWLVWKEKQPVGHLPDTEVSSAKPGQRATEDSPSGVPTISKVHTEDAPFVDFFKKLARDWRDIAEGRGRRDQFFEWDHPVRYLHRRLEEVTGISRDDFEEAAFRINTPNGLASFRPTRGPGGKVSGPDRRDLRHILAEFRRLDLDGIAQLLVEELREKFPEEIEAIQLNRIQSESKSNSEVGASINIRAGDGGDAGLRGVGGAGASINIRAGDGGNAGLGGAGGPGGNITFTAQEGAPGQASAAKSPVLTSDADGGSANEMSEGSSPIPDKGKRPFPIEVFCAYSHANERQRHKLEKHLSQLKNDGLVSTWHDRKIGAGKEWEGEIDNHLNSAQIILLLISDSFLHSDYCYGVEMNRAMERHKAGEALVIPVILRPCDWHSAPFAKLEALPEKGKPVTDWDTHDHGYTNVVKGIRAAISDRNRSNATTQGSIVSSPSQLSGRAHPIINLDPKELRMPPKLVLSFDKERDVEHQRNTLGLDRSVLSTWVRIRVANPNGRKVAKNCRGYLIGISPLGTETKVGLPNSSRQLTWEHLPGKFERDLHAGDDHRIDVLHAASNEACLRFSVFPDVVLNAAGIYELTIRVSAEDADSEIITLRIQWDGTWDSLRALD